MGYGVRVGKGVFTSAWGEAQKKHSPGHVRYHKSPEYMKPYLKKYYQEHKEEALEACKRQCPPLSKLLPAEALHPPGQQREEIPPCGGDCQNCPYDEGCRYPTWDEDHANTYIAPDGTKHDREKRRAAWKRSNAKRRERAKTDPTFAETERKRNNLSSRKHYYKVQFAKCGIWPDEFEKAWAAAGSLKVFKKVWADCARIPSKFMTQLSREKEKTDNGHR